MVLSRLKHNRRFAGLSLGSSSPAPTALDTLVSGSLVTASTIAFAPTEQTVGGDTYISDDGGFTDIIYDLKDATKTRFCQAATITNRPETQADNPYILPDGADDRLLANASLLAHINSVLGGQTSVSYIFAGKANYQGGVGSGAGFELRNANGYPFSIWSGDILLRATARMNNGGTSVTTNAPSGVNGTSEWAIFAVTATQGQPPTIWHHGTTIARAEVTNATSLDAGATPTNYNGFSLCGWSTSRTWKKEWSFMAGIPNAINGTDFDNYAAELAAYMGITLA